MSERDATMKKSLKQKRYLRCGVLLLTAAILLSVTSCALRTSAAELSEGYSRQATEQGAVDDAFITAISDFSLSLFRESVTKEADNDLISPLSAVLCLSMIANGAAGETKAQMENALGMNTEKLNKCLYSYLSGLYTSDSCKVNLANSIWFRDTYQEQISKDFLQTNADWYNAQIYSAPFNSSTVKDVNNWVKHYSDGMIDSILNNISPLTVMYLINALTFDAKWETKYEKDQIRENLFTNYDKSQTTTEMMYSEESIYLSGEGVQGFAKNYAGGQYSFVALLPEENKDIYDYAASLNGEAWRSLWKNKENTAVRVAIPEFRYDRQRSLIDVLQNLGMTDMFDETLADFSALAPKDFLYCSEINQKVFIEVDRNGTKAAAITWEVMNGKSAAIAEEKVVYLDRPFLYAIVDNNTGLPLFLGIVTAL